MSSIENPIITKNTLFPFTLSKKIYECPQPQHSTIIRDSSLKTVDIIVNISKDKFGNLALTYIIPHEDINDVFKNNNKTDYSKQKDKYYSEKKDTEVLKSLKNKEIKLIYGNFKKHPLISIVCKNEVYKTKLTLSTGEWSPLKCIDNVSFPEKIKYLFFLNSYLTIIDDKANLNFYENECSTPFECYKLVKDNETIDDLVIKPWGRYGIHSLHQLVVFSKKTKTISFYSEQGRLLSLNEKQILFPPYSNQIDIKLTSIKNGREIFFLEDYLLYVELKRSKEKSPRLLTLEKHYYKNFQNNTLSIFIPYFISAKKRYFHEFFLIISTQGNKSELLLWPSKSEKSRRFIFPPKLFLSDITSIKSIRISTYSHILVKTAEKQILYGINKRKIITEISREMQRVVTTKAKNCLTFSIPRFDQKKYKRPLPSTKQIRRVLKKKKTVPLSPPTLEVGEEKSRPTQGKRVLSPLGATPPKDLPQPRGIEPFVYPLVFSSDLAYPQSTSRLPSLPSFSELLDSIDP